MADLLLLPAFIVIVGAILVALAPTWLRAPLVLLTPMVGLAAILRIPDGAMIGAPFMGYEIAILEGGALRRLFAASFAILAFAAGLFSLKQGKRWELAAGLGCAGGAIGVAFSGDLIALYLFWEIMALCATVLVWSGGTESAQRAGIRYITLHLLRGLVLKLGMEEVLIGTGSLAIRPLSLADPGAWILLGALFVSAAAPPFSYWVADAFPESTPRSNVWLSGLTTTTGVFALLFLFPGEAFLIGIGLWMVFYGTLYAILEDEVRRALSYGSVSLSGFVVCGIGIGSDASIAGAAAFAIVSLFAMGLLFMSAGVVEEATGERKYSALGGLYPGMPLTAICSATAALTLVGLPLTGGFASVPLLWTETGGIQATAITALLLLGVAGVVLQLGVRFPWLLFFRGRSDGRGAEPTLNQRAAMVLLAALCLVMGIVPGLLYSALPASITSPYTLAPIFLQLLILGAAGAGSLFLLPKIRRTTGVGWDWDWIYRTLGGGLVRAVLGIGTRGGEALSNGMMKRLDGLLAGFFRTYGPQGSLARSWPTGSMVLWVGVMLGAYLVFALL